MRVGTKLTVVTIAGVLLVLAIHGYYRIQRESELFMSDMERDHRTLARGLGLAAQVVADRSGIEAAAALLRDANEREARMTIAWVAPEPGETTRAAAVHAKRVADGEEWLISSVPLRLRGTPGVLEMRESLAQQQSYVQATAGRNALEMAQVALLCAVVIVGSALLVVGRPMRILLAKVKRIGSGDLGSPVTLPQHDEMGELARALNAMCDQLGQARANLEVETRSRIAAVEQMRHADRLSIVGRLASGVAHELGTPLNVVLAHARLIARQQAPDANVAADAAVIVEQGERMTAIIRQLLDLARRHTPRKRSEDVRSIVNRTVAVIEPVASRGGVALHGESEKAPLIAEVDAEQIRQVVANLLMNAIQAQPHGGVVRVYSEPVGRSELRICVEDEGVGIVAEDRERIFEPFFTTKAPGDGTGLGLTISYGIVSDHGGRIEVQSSAGTGSAFTVFLPRGGQPVSASA